MATEPRIFTQGQTVTFGGHLLTVGMVLNVTAPMDPDDAPGVYLAVRMANWPKGQVWLIPAKAVDPFAPLVA